MDTLHRVCQTERESNIGGSKSRTGEALFGLNMRVKVDVEVKTIAKCRLLTAVPPKSARRRSRIIIITGTPEARTRRE